ncbi:hypothetical protein [Pedobacter cryoconitis]|uniref:Uncharacterized protein n=1 Tax=Pedobacter cryoconitis TaxID=188932 RepID=A0A7X0J0T0_9SPHI|nr:hypothetical protein [Pedobacter cryoconitis]MBB6498989.1 hypothetical protein [Pedobacter cryoconitis]
MINKELESTNEENLARYIVQQLGITYEELQETSYTLEEHESKSGLVYSRYIRFDETSSKEVLDKIIGLQNNDIDINLPDEPDEDYYDPNEDRSHLLMSDEIDIPLKIMPQIAEEERCKRDEGK